MEYKKKLPDSLSLSPSSLTSSTLSSTGTTSSSSSSALSGASTTSITSSESTFTEIQKKATVFLNNKYLKAVLYIILILYASVIAPKLPSWIIPYLEYPIVKMFIIFIIGLLATQDPTAAIIATIGVSVTYLFITDLQYTNYIKNISDNENKENKVNKIKKENKENKEIKMCIPNNKPIEQFNENNYNYNSINENMIRNANNPVFESQSYTYDQNQNIENFDVMHNNNCFINHIEEHFNTN
jgi:hypothetical protein